MRKGKIVISNTFLLFICSINIIISSSSGSSNIEFEGELELMLLQAASGGLGRCNREMSSGECIRLEETTEINSRRVLWASSSYDGAHPETSKRYISYEALRRDNVPCDRPGIPYYSCHALPRANPYSRGCSVITRCARGD